MFVVKFDRDVARDLYVLDLVLAHRHDLRVIKQDISRHQNWIAKESVVRANALCDLVFVAVLSQYTPMGLLERAHSYKDKVAKGLSSHHGLFSYPVLMAADILLYNAQVVPVGKDQIQHVEIARDIAIKFNNEHGEIFTLPEAKIDENVATVPGNKRRKDEQKLRQYDRYLRGRQDA